MIEIAEKTNLFDLDVQAFAQGCNAIGQMGSGIAYWFHKQWPEMYEDYHQYCVAHRCVAQGMHAYKLNNDKWIFNLFTQLNPGPCATLDRCSIAFDAMLQFAKMNDVDTIGMPGIGCGIGGLNWKDVQRTLEESIERNTYEGKITVAFL